MRPHFTLANKLLCSFVCLTAACLFESPASGQDWLRPTAAVVNPAESIANRDEVMFPIALEPLRTRSTQASRFKAREAEPPPRGEFFRDFSTRHEPRREAASSLSDVDRLFAQPRGNTSAVEPVVALLGIEPATESSDERFAGNACQPASPFDDALACPCEPIGFRNDVRDLWPMLRDDACSVVTWKNAIILGVATGGAIAIRQDWDGQVRAETAEHPDRWGETSQVLRQFGEATWQVPVMFGVYGYSVWQQDEELHSFSKAAISAHALSALTTVAIKGIIDTQRPTTEFHDGRYGFPSYHTASTFALAATIEEYYGWKAGLPAYTLAGLVGWSRIDQREHDLSDVLFGAVLGYTIGKSVAAAHLERDFGVNVLPYYEPTSRTSGIMLDFRF
jgi:hypothetical protein